MKQKSKNKKRRNAKRLTIMLAAITSAIWLILVILKILIGNFSLSQLFDDIVANLLGILPPIIIFNFAYEYLTKEYISDEISEQITQTLMSNPETLSVFNKQAKKNFLRATISTIVTESEAKMVYGVIEPYLDSKYNLKKFFRYTINIQHSSKIRDLKSEYLYISECLSYRKCFLNGNSMLKRFHIGFFTSLGDLDKELHQDNYLFRESLVVSEEDLLILTSMSDHEKLDFLQQQMQFLVRINNIEILVNGVIIDERGIDVDCSCGDFSSLMEVQVEVNFCMPQLKSDNKFLISITEPTYSPFLTVIYPDDIKLSVFSFLNDDDKTLTDNIRNNDSICQIDVQNGWIMPVSGIVFLIE